ncbi:VOC family protein [Nocardia sp. NBC_00416]|uniref:VOC family protein n=1 Tax=Nocardia sp. NBC_00416 TaxID=2975991 RepID=UPI002E1B21AF
MKADDHFHLGLVTTDMAATVAALSAALGYEWGDQLGNIVQVTGPSGVDDVELACVFSITEPRLEVVRAVPGTLWEPVAGGGVHHLGYWSDDVTADIAELVGHGWQVEATREMPDGALFFAFLQKPGGFRIELVDRRAEPSMRRCWQAPAER